MFAHVGLPRLQWTTAVVIAILEIARGIAVGLKAYVCAIYIRMHLTRLALLRPIPAGHGNFSDCHVLTGEAWLRCDLCMLGYA